MTVREENPLRVLVVASAAGRRADLAEMAVKAAPARATTSPAISPDRIRQMDADVVMVDIDSPRMAAATLRLLQAAPAGVIALAENAEPRWTAAALAAGIVAILSREVMADELKLAFMAADAGLVLLHPSSIQHPALRFPDFDDQEDIGHKNTAYREDGSATMEALTPREHEVLRLLSSGLGNREIAQRLAISEHTVKFHVSSVLGKLGAGSRTEAVTQGIRKGLIPM
jgi:DNA-binding NarL/FixJ family response regulator